MTFAGDDPEIVLGGDPPPSAPLPSALASARPVTASTSSALPTAMATPLLATPVPPAPARPAAVTTSGARIERSTNADGSLTVKLTTTTPRPNGYREIKVEHFQIPAGMADAVARALDAGEPPNSLYMTKMEQRTLPPPEAATTTTTGRPPTGTSRPASLGTPGTPRPQNANAQHDWDNESTERDNQPWAIAGVLCVFALVIGLFYYFKNKESSSRSSSYGSPSAPNWSPSYTPPSPWTFRPTPRPVFQPPYYPSRPYYPSQPYTPSIPSPYVPPSPSNPFPSGFSFPPEFAPVLPPTRLTRYPHASSGTATPTNFLRRFGITPEPSGALIDSPTNTSRPPMGAVGSPTNPPSERSAEVTEPPSERSATAMNAPSRQPVTATESPSRQPVVAKESNSLDGGKEGRV